MPFYVRRLLDANGNHITSLPGNVYGAKLQMEMLRYGASSAPLFNPQSGCYACDSCQKADAKVSHEDLVLCLLCAKNFKVGEST